MNTILILGARGRLGFAAAQAFAQAGWRVVAHVRPGASGPAVPGVRWLAANVRDTAALAAQAAGAQVVLHALNPSAYTHAAWRAQALPLMDAAISTATRLQATLLLPGNVYPFGAAMPPVLREGAAHAPTTAFGRIRQALEERLQAATTQGLPQAVVLRAGDFFGSGTGTLLDLLAAKHLRQGRMTWPGPLDVPTPWAYLPDLARAFERVAARRAQLGAFTALHFAGHHATGAQWAHALQAAAQERGWIAPHAALRVGHVPWALLRLAGSVVPPMAALHAMHYLWRTPHALDNTRLQALIGPEPHTPFATAVSAAMG